MAKIIINRKGEWMNRMRGIKVFIDGKQVGIVKNDSAEEFVVDAGTHTVECKIDWCGCKPVQLTVADDGDVKILKLQSGMTYLKPLYFIFFAVVLGRLLFRLSGQHVPDWLEIGQFVIAVPVLLYFIYYLTIGRKHYLSLDYDKSNPFS
jgi:hypothetical protein